MIDQNDQKLENHSNSEQVRKILIQLSLGILIVINSVIKKLESLTTLSLRNLTILINYYNYDWSQSLITSEVTNLQLAS